LEIKIKKFTAEIAESAENSEIKIDNKKKHPVNQKYSFIF